MRNDTKINEISLGFHPPDVSTVRPILMVFDKNQFNECHLIVQKEMVLGRDKEADIEINDDTISRRHSMVRYENIDRPAEKPYCTLGDAGSRNGTYVNGEKVCEPVELKHGDRVFIGNTCLIFFLRTEVEIFSDQRLRLLATTDPLTGLMNRSYMAIQYDREFDRSRRYVRPLSLLMIDIDDFKKVNDTFGHPVGDEVLVQVGKILLASSRKHDIAARYGGEEFTLILPETPLYGSTIIAERLRNKISHTEFKIDNRVLKISISIGISEMNPVNPMGLETLIFQADQALLMAKKQGKNCLWVYDPNTGISE